MKAKFDEMPAVEDWIIMGVEGIAIAKIWCIPTKFAVMQNLEMRHPELSLHLRALGPKICKRFWMRWWTWKSRKKWFMNEQEVRQSNMVHLQQNLIRVRNLNIELWIWNIHGNPTICDRLRSWKENRWNRRRIEICVQLQAWTRLSNSSQCHGVWRFHLHLMVSCHDFYNGVFLSPWFVHSV